MDPAAKSLGAGFADQLGCVASEKQWLSLENTGKPVRLSSPLPHFQAVFSIKT
jgi:hypothetical protein